MFGNMYINFLIQKIRKTSLLHSKYIFAAIIFLIFYTIAKIVLNKIKYVKDNKNRLKKET